MIFIILIPISLAERGPFPNLVQSQKNKQNIPIFCDGLGCKRIFEFHFSLDWLKPPKNGEIVDACLKQCVYGIFNFSRQNTLNNLS